MAFWKYLPSTIKYSYTATCSTQTATVTEKVQQFCQCQNCAPSCIDLQSLQGVYKSSITKFQEDLNNIDQAPMYYNMVVLHGTTNFAPC